jgi:hypothetical protein
MFDDITKIAENAKRRDRTVTKIQQEMAALNERIGWDRNEFDPNRSDNPETDASTASADD